MASAAEIAQRMRDKKKAGDAEDETVEEEETMDEPEVETAAEDEAMDDYDSVLDSAVADLMATKDPAAFKSALRQAVQAIVDGGEEE